MTEPLIIGRYLVGDQIGAGGMATVHLGRVLGAAGFSRVIAIKRLHSQRAESDKLATSLVDEARIVARIRHPNVVPTLDVVRTNGELLLVMEYVHGPSLAWLMTTLRGQGAPMPQRIALRIAIDTLEGLHAAHQAKSERGRPLEIVHRDVSPANILVGDDGIVRVVDFGVAKAEGRLGVTSVGEIKGKLAYMSPEQVRGESVDRRTDLFALGVVLWEMLAGRRLFKGEGGQELREMVRGHLSTKLEEVERGLASAPPEVQAAVRRGLAMDRAERFDTAEEMATALGRAPDVATTKDVGLWVRAIARELLARRLEQLDQVEQVSGVSVPSVSLLRAEPRAVTAAAPPVDTLVPSTVPDPRVPPTVEDAVLPTVTMASPSPAPTPRPDGGTLLSAPLHVAPNERTVVTAAPPVAVVPPRPLPWAVLAALGIAAVAASLGLVAYALYPRLHASRTASAAVPVSVPVSPPPPTTTAPMPMITTTIAPSAAPEVAPPPPSASPSSAVPPRPRPSPARRSCNPPYTVDPDGVRIAKPECID